MFKLDSKKIIIFIFLILVLIGFFYLKSQKKEIEPKASVEPTTQNEQPKIISTKPDPLDEAIVSSNQTLEITFNKPLENIGEFKHKIEPEIDLKIELSSDRKTVKITPQKPFELNTTYTLFILPDTKFDGADKLGEDQIFHFRTIPYKGV